jgi:hypothetical protein
MVHEHLRKKYGEPTPGTIQVRLNQAFLHILLCRSTQRRRVLQYIVDHPDQLTHHINAATSCGNIPHVVTHIARQALLEVGLVIYCYAPGVVHMTNFEEVSRVNVWRAVFIEDYDAVLYGELS